MIAPRSEAIWKTATVRPLRAGERSPTIDDGTLASSEAASPKAAIATRNAARVGGSTSTATEAVARPVPSTSEGRRPQVSASRPARSSPSACASDPASSPAPAQAAVRPSSSTTYRGTSELRTPNSTHPTPRFATSAAR